jgi:hypothetical protein
MQTAAQPTQQPAFELPPAARAKDDVARFTSPHETGERVQIHVHVRDSCGLALPTGHAVTRGVNALTVYRTDLECILAAPYLVADAEEEQRIAQARADFDRKLAVAVLKRVRDAAENPNVWDGPEHLQRVAAWIKSPTRESDDDRAIAAAHDYVARTTGLSWQKSFQEIFERGPAPITKVEVVGEAERSPNHPDTQRERLAHSLSGAQSGAVGEALAAVLGPIVQSIQSGNQATVEALQKLAAKVTK